MKELFAEEFIKSNKLKYRAICNTYKILKKDIESKYHMYKIVNELLEDEEVQSLIEICEEEQKDTKVLALESEVLKTNKALWDTYNTASQIENKLTKNGEPIDGFYKFQDSNVVVATLQILARNVDEIRKEIESIKGVKEKSASDIITIEWK